MLKLHISTATLVSDTMTSMPSFPLSCPLLTNSSRISPNLRAIPNFHLMGKPDPPEILSNKVVLTPPAPGNHRGAAWSETQLLHSWWSADIDFRATGPERGGGNLQIWYAANGKDTVGTSSIYTAGRFDGLALVVDQYAGSVGLPKTENKRSTANSIYRAVS
jgi:hypothetical protein